MFSQLSENASVSNLESFDISLVLIALALSTVSSLIISQIYKRTHRGMNYELSFMSTIVLLAPIVCLVMLFIRGDLVLSLGLIGSLSIIRFRTPIKDTRDMVFLFWTIASGLGCGTFNWAIVIVATICISVIIYVLYLLKYGRSQNSDYILVVSGHSESKPDAIEDRLNEQVEEFKVRSYEIVDSNWEIIYELRYARSTRELNLDLIDTVKACEGVSKVSLLAPQLALPV